MDSAPTQLNPSQEPKTGQILDPLVRWEVTVPIRTVSEANKKEHWTVSSKRHRMQKQHTRLFLQAYAKNVRLPCTIKFTRIAPRPLDAHENLPMAFKYIVDTVADFLIPGKPAGHADSDPRLKFLYDQEKGDAKEYKIKITFY